MNISKICNITAGIRRYYQVSDPSLDMLAASLEERNYSWGHLLTRPGIKDHYVYFIEEGCTRTYLSVNGKELTNWFSCEAFGNPCRPVRSSINHENKDRFSGHTQTKNAFKCNDLKAFLISAVKCLTR